MEIDLSRNIVLGNFGIVVSSCSCSFWIFIALFDFSGKLYSKNFGIEACGIVLRVYRMRDDEIVPKDSFWMVFIVLSYLLY